MKKTLIYITSCVFFVIVMIGTKNEITKRCEIYDAECKYKKSMIDQNYPQAFVDAGNVADMYFKYNDLENYNKWDSIQFSLSTKIKCPY